MMTVTVIEKIKEKITKLADLEITEESINSITVKPKHEKSFPVSLVYQQEKYFLYFKAWNAIYTTEEEALDAFAFGLSDDCRLQVISFGETEYKWILEYRENDKWIKESETAIQLFPFWQKKRVNYYQNKVILHNAVKVK